MSTTDDDAGRTLEDVAALRHHLFATITALRDTASPMPVDRAMAVSEVARTIIESARVEVEAARMNKMLPNSRFLAPPTLPAPTAHEPAVPTGINGITRHLLSDDEPQARGVRR